MHVDETGHDHMRRRWDVLTVYQHRKVGYFGDGWSRQNVASNLSDFAVISSNISPDSSDVKILALSYVFSITQS